jgi:hypothetical protein
MIISLMEVKEHFYSDDPAKGPPDVRTTLPGVKYFFLGNGLIQAAVQVSPFPGSTAAGLLIMEPERLGPKRCALTFDPVSGIGPTQISVIEGRKVFRPGAKAVKARWVSGGVFPRVEVTWRGGPFLVTELFYCPDGEKPRLSRFVTVTHLSPGASKVRIRTGLGRRTVEKSLTFMGKEKEAVLFDYRILGPRRKPTVGLEAGGTSRIDREEARFWARAASCRTSDPLLDGFFSAAKFGLRAVVSRSGTLDGGIWQYNLEWVRDQAFIAAALVMSGQFESARTILERLLREFVSEDGATMDSSRLRPWEESEFDQNGALLFALETYINWTGDQSLLEGYWRKIVRAADFPLKKFFRHRESGLLSNRREFWERHSAHGIRDGMELAHQLFVSMGLAAAGRIAGRMREGRKARAWQDAAARLKRAMLGPGRFSLVENGRLIKRRGTDGKVQAEVSPQPDLGLPVQTPLFAKGRHFLNPDTSTALPIAWEFIDPAGLVARRTLASLETLWNQAWSGGGYGRYNVTSEPDSPGPWPFASLFVARARFEAGNDRKVRRVLEWLGRLPGAKAGSWFEFYGPRPVPPYPQVGVVPWVWAEMLFLFIHHMLGARPMENALRLRPRLLQGLKWMDASLRLRGGRVDLLLRRAGRGERPGFIVGKRKLPFRKSGLELPLPVDGQTVQVEAIWPR